MNHRAGRPRDASNEPKAKSESKSRSGQPTRGGGRASGGRVPVTTNAKTEPRYRLVVFDEVDEPQAVRDLFCQVTDMHPTDAMLWVARAPGAWAQPLPADQARALLDGLYDLGVAAE